MRPVEPIPAALLVSGAGEQLEIGTKSRELVEMDTVVNGGGSRFSSHKCPEHAQTNELTHEQTNKLKKLKVTKAN